MKTTFGLAGYVGGTAVKTGTKAVDAPFHLTKAVAFSKAVPAAAPRCAVCFTYGCAKHVGGK